MTAARRGRGPGAARRAAASPRPLLLLAPGAGAPSTSPWLRAWAARLAAVGDVAPFDYPYQLAALARGRRGRPDPLPRLVAAHAAALAAARAARPGAPAVLVGKSMGSRVGCHLAVEALAGAPDPVAPPVAGLVCLGYPLVGASRARRDAVLLALRTPVLFVQGTRDRLCPLELLAEVRGRMAAPSDLHVVETGDHDLAITARHARATGTTQADADAAALAAVAAFVVRVTAPTG